MKIVRITALWCVSCLVMQKTWKKVFSEIDDVEIIDFDYDEDFEKIKELNVGKTLPVLIVYSNNQEKIRIIGEKNYKELIKIFKDLE